MKTVKDLGFRGCFGQYVLIKAPLADVVSVTKFDWDSEADAFIAFGYVDNQAGLSFEVLCPAFTDSPIFAPDYYPADQGSRVIVRSGCVMDLPATILHPEALDAIFADKILPIEQTYNEPAELFTTRLIEEIDESRHVEYPDDVQVMVGNQEYGWELMWVRLHAFENSELLGELLNEPNELPNVHRGDILSLRLTRNADGSFSLIYELPTGTDPEKAILLKWKMGAGNSAKAIAGEDAMPQKNERATADSWNIQAMPEECITLEVGLALGEREYEVLKQGHIPEAMEDHWFMYFDEAANQIRYFRSWTGICWCQAEVEECNGGYVITRAVFNRSPEQYGSANNEADVALLKYLVAEEVGMPSASFWNEYVAAQ